MRDGGSVRIDTEGEWVDGEREREREREREQRGEDEWLLLVAAYDRGRENPEPHVTTYHAQTFFCFVSSIAFLLFLLNTYRHLHGSMTRWYRSRYGAINDLPFLFLFYSDDPLLKRIDIRPFITRRTGRRSIGRAVRLGLRVPNIYLFWPTNNI